MGPHLLIIHCACHRILQRGEGWLTQLRIEVPRLEKPAATISRLSASPSLPVLACRGPDRVVQETLNSLYSYEWGRAEKGWEGRGGVSIVFVFPIDLSRVTKLAFRILPPKTGLVRPPLASSFVKPVRCLAPCLLYSLANTCSTPASHSSSSQIPFVRA